MSCYFPPGLGTFFIVMVTVEPSSGLPSTTLEKLTHVHAHTHTLTGCLWDRVLHCWCAGFLRPSSGYPWPTLVHFPTFSVTTLPAFPLLTSVLLLQQAGGPSAGPGEVGLCTLSLAGMALSLAGAPGWRPGLGSTHSEVAVLEQILAGQSRVTRKSWPELVCLGC